MKKKYRFEFKDGSERVFELTEKQRLCFVKDDVWGCKDCGNCYFNYSATKVLCPEDILSITEIEEVDVENYYDSNRNVGSEYVEKEESADNEKILKCLKHLVIETHEVLAWGNIDDDVKHVFDNCEKVLNEAKELINWKKVIKKKAKKVKFLAYFYNDRLLWQTDEKPITEEHKRVPSEDKIIEIEV